MRKITLFMIVGISFVTMNIWSMDNRTRVTADEQRSKDAAKRKAREITLSEKVGSTCALCSQRITIEPIDGPCVLHCSHVVHKLCILDRLDQDKRTSCPTCRESIFRKQDE